MQRVTPAWAGSYFWVFIAFVIAGVIAYVVLSCLPNAKKWIAFISVLFGGLSIISISMQSHERIAQIEHGSLDWKLKSDAGGIRDSIDNAIYVFCEIKRVRSDFSPPDFDEIVESQNQGCEMMKRISNYASGILGGKEQRFERQDLGQSKLYSPIVRDRFEKLDREIAAYNQTVDARAMYAAGDNGFVQAIKGYTLLFEPFLAAIALAFGLVSVKFSN